MKKEIRMPMNLESYTIIVKIGDENFWYLDKVFEKIIQNIIKQRKYWTLRMIV